MLGKPQCTGKSSLTESETTTLTCTVQYTQGSTAPQVEWQSPHNAKKRRRKRATTQGIVKASVEVTGEWHEDGAKRMCLVTLYGHTDQCTIVTSVTCKLCVVMAKVYCNFKQLEIVMSHAGVT